VLLVFVVHLLKYIFLRTYLFTLSFTNIIVTYTRLDQLRENIHTKWAYKNNNDNVIRLNQTTQKAQTPEESSTREDKE
jgi:hypothetical protein